MYRVAIAGSTKYTQHCAQTFLGHDQFELSFAITPALKPIGRKNRIVANPLAQFFTKQNLPVIYVQQKMDGELKAKILQQPKPDLLLVVDFGYFIPNWLLKLPPVATLNIHPSLLPRWRGSSPGQFVLLSGETESGVTLMRINDRIDQGPIIAQKKFKVGSDWTQQDYYDHSFKIICQDLPQLCLEYIENRQETPQSLESPTPYAEKLTKEDGFIEWEEVATAMAGTAGARNAVAGMNQSVCRQIERSARAYYPWPSLWTTLPTKRGPKRMKILSVSCENDILKLKKVQIEGQSPALWNQVKNQVAQN